MQVSGRRRSQQAPRKAQQFETEFKVEVFTNHYVMAMAISRAKLTMNPYHIEQEMSEILGTKPKSISASGKERFLVEVRNQKQSEKMSKIVTIGCQQCSVKKHPFCNGVKELLYIKNSNIEDEESFKEGLKKEFYVTKVERAA